MDSKLFHQELMIHMQNKTLLSIIIKLLLLTFLLWSYFSYNLTQLHIRSITNALPLDSRNWSYKMIRKHLERWSQGYWYLVVTRIINYGLWTIVDNSSQYIRKSIEDCLKIMWGNLFGRKDRLVSDTFQHQRIHFREEIPDKKICVARVSRKYLNWVLSYEVCFLFAKIKKVDQQIRDEEGWIISKLYNSDVYSLLDWCVRTIFKLNIWKAHFS